MLHPQQPAAVAGGIAMPRKQGVWQGVRTAVSVPGAAALFETRIPVQSALTTARWVGEGRRSPPCWHTARKAVGEAISQAVSTKIV